MLRIIKYLKPYVPQVVVAIVLLFIQANADLALPDYMSRIVNVGIQQGGVQEAVPAAIRKIELDRLVTLMGEEDRGTTLSAYSLVEPGSSGASAYVARYPRLETEPVYVLGDIDRAMTDRLNLIVGRSVLVARALSEATADPRKSAALAQGIGVDLSQLPPGTDLFDLVGRMPDAARVDFATAITRRFDTMGEKMIVQAAAAGVRDEYEQLGVNTGRLQSSYIVRVGGSMILLTLLSVACTIAVGFLSARTAAGLARDLRTAMFERVENFANAEFDTFSTASLITRSTNDITQVQMVVMMIIRMVFYAPIIGVGGVIRAIGKSASMWWIIAIAVGVLMVLVVVVYRVAVPKFKVMQRLMDRLNLVARESLSGMMVVRAFNRQRHEEGRFDLANEELTGTALFVNRVMVVMMPLMMLIMNGLTILVIWVGSHEIQASSMQVGDMMAFMQYAVQIVFAFLMMSMMFIMLPRASVSAGRVADVLSTAPSIKDPVEPETFAGSFDGRVELRNVSFRYPHAEEDVIHDVSFTAMPGATTAIIGATGAGKTTIVNLIPRFYDVTGGAVHVGGRDVRTVAQHDLRERIGYVPQKASLFSGTIESNLRYADEDASAQTLAAATEMAQATEFIAARPEGMAAEIAQGGANVSGGQKQRLSIARALVKHPPVLIFDDSFSALDFRTDAALRRALREKAGESTLIIVTQRIAGVMNADHIVVLEEGRVVGQGRHRELMESCAVYREIASSQLVKEEIA
jgi:ATP-binding cassette subfamily B protein